jgi:hypothetical protein
VGCRDELMPTRGCARRSSPPAGRVGCSSDTATSRASLASRPAARSCGSLR